MVILVLKFNNVPIFSVFGASRTLFMTNLLTIMRKYWKWQKTVYPFFGGWVNNFLAEIINGRWQDQGQVLQITYTMLIKNFCAKNTWYFFLICLINQIWIVLFDTQINTYHKHTIDSCSLCSKNHSIGNQRLNLNQFCLCIFYWFGFNLQNFSRYIILITIFAVST